MKKLIAVLLILMLIAPAAGADNLAETIEQYNSAAEFTGVPQVTSLPVDGTYLCLETGMLLMFIKSETSDDIDLVSCMTFGKPDGEAFLLTACTLLHMYTPSNDVTNFGRLLQSFMIAKNNNVSAGVVTSNDLLGRITYNKDQYQFYLELK